MADDIKAYTEALVEALNKYSAANSLTTAVSLAEIKKDLESHEESIDVIKKVLFDQHDPVITWSKGFMESYRKIVLTIVTSGILALIGFLVEVYILLHKANVLPIK